MKQRKLFDILNFSIINKDLYFERTNNSFYKNNELLFSKIEGYSCFKDNIVVLFLDYAFLINESSFKRFDFRFNAIYITEDTIFVKKELSIDRKKYSYFLYDSINSKVSFYSKEFYFIGHPLLIFNQLYLVKEDKKTVCNLEIKTETTLWQYSVADLGAEKVSKMLGAFGETLVVVCKMPVYPEHILIGIDINNGKLLWSVNLPQYLMHSNLFYYEQNNSIISLRRNFLWEFSLSSMEVIREKQLPETFKYNTLNVQVELASLYGDLIYFAGKDLENVRPSALVGVFDLKTEKLVDVHDLQSDGTFTVGGNSRPQVSGNKIYVQDTKNTLHILEREVATPDLNQ